MDYKPKNREWVKNAAIIFLAVLLVLTFFSNTIMNRSLPEVATQNVTSGSITAKVRGTGTVTAIGNHVVKAEQTREIRAVMIKAGQTVEAGDILFILGEGESSEIEQAQETLRKLQVSYQRAAIGVPAVSYKAEEHEIERAREELKEAREALEAVKKKASREIPSAQLEEAEQELYEAKLATQAAKDEVDTRELELEDKKIERDAIKTMYNDKLNQAIDNRQWWQDMVADQQATVDALKKAKEEGSEDPDIDQKILEAETELAQDKLRLEEAVAREKALLDPASQIELTEAERAVQEADDKVRNAEDAYSDAQTAEAAAAAKVEALQAVIDEIMGTETVSEEYKKAREAVIAAEDRLFTLENNLELKKISDAKSQSLSYLDLTDLGQQIERAKQKLAELSGGEENQILAKVSGTVQSVECTAGETKAKGDALATIEVPDMGYTLSFTVTNDQARRLKVGDTATVSNYYWGKQITATLESIRVDPKNPQTNKLLTFNVDGDVNVGAELTISVGQKSANYDLIVPNSAVRSDANGSFVLKIEAKSSPLGNRYIARRVNVEVLAEDDMNSAVTGDLSNWGDFVITTSNAPVKSGDMVRLADNG